MPTSAPRVAHRWILASEGPVLKNRRTNEDDDTWAAEMMWLETWDRIQPDIKDYLVKVERRTDLPLLTAWFEPHEPIEGVGYKFKVEFAGSSAGVYITVGHDSLGKASPTAVAREIQYAFEDIEGRAKKHLRGRQR
jgi:hypothetical protein